MAGHSQFKNIMHRKGAQDAKRSKLFSKLGREITVAAKTGIPDPATNSRLRAAMAAARIANMPRDNIERALKKAASNDDLSNFEEIRYEGFGPGGISVIVEALTDNRNRTASEIRHAFSKNGGNLGETGSVSYLFDRVGEILYPASAASHDKMFEAALEAGAQNVEFADNQHQIHCEPGDLRIVQEALEKAFGPAEKVGLVWLAKSDVDIDEETAGSVLKLIDMLDDNDDVQNVFANYSVSDEILKKLGS